MAYMYGYGRASTDKQQITIKSQQEICERYFELRKASGSEHEWGGWHPDAAVSATLHFQQRPMGEAILRKMVRGDAMVVSNFDRLFRSVIDCHYCIETFNERGLTLCILDAGIQTDTPLGAAMMKFIAIIKELEKEEISRRTRDAIHYKYRKGLPIHGQAPIGWQKKGYKSKSYFAPYEIERQWCYEIVKMREENGLGFARIGAFMRNNRGPSETYRDNYDKASMRWPLKATTRAYIAAKLGFPCIAAKHLPNREEVSQYLVSNNGLQPRIEPSSYKRGFLHTVPPKQGQPAIAFSPGCP